MKLRWIPAPRECFEKGEYWNVWVDDEFPLLPENDKADSEAEAVWVDLWMWVNQHFGYKRRQ